MGLVPVAVAEAVPVAEALPEVVLEVRTVFPPAQATAATAMAALSALVATAVSAPAAP
jgi:hypothetical protein